MSRRRALEAARWAERIADDAGTAAGRRFERWSGDAANRNAFDRTADVRTLAVALADDPELAQIRAESVARITGAANDTGHAPWWIAVTAAVAMTVALPLYLAPGERPAPEAPLPTYHTAVGQRLAVTLPDGSHLTLDTASRVRMAYNGAERRLVIEQGQAMFDVAHGQQRPFVVAAAGREVVAHGTRFDVRLRGSGVQVALVEGRVTVGARGKAGVPMMPDDILVADGGDVKLRSDPAGVAALTAWREGVLVFQDRALGEAVAEMNRYAVRPIVLGDAAVGRARISGSFRTGDIATFTDALRLGFPISVTRRDDGAVVLTRR